MRNVLIYIFIFEFILSIDYVSYACRMGWPTVLCVCAWCMRPHQLPHISTHPTQKWHLHNNILNNWEVGGSFSHAIRTSFFSSFCCLRVRVAVFFVYLLLLLSSSSCWRVVNPIWNCLSFCLYGNDVPRWADSPAETKKMGILWHVKMTQWTSVERSTRATTQRTWADFHLCKREMLVQAIIHAIRAEREREGESHLQEHKRYF